jgi:hypothetical protein
MPRNTERLVGSVTHIHRKIARNSGTYQAQEHKTTGRNSGMCQAKECNKTCLSADLGWVQSSKEAAKGHQNGLVTELYTIFRQEICVTCTIHVNTAFLGSGQRR